MGSCSAPVLRPSQPDHHSCKNCMAPRATPFKAFYYLFATHHLLAKSKQADLRAWSKELGLVGLAKRGYPGIILLTAVDDGAQDRLGDVAQRIKVRAGGQEGEAIVVANHISLAGPQMGIARFTAYSASTHRASGHSARCSCSIGRSAR